MSFIIQCILFILMLGSITSCHPVSIVSGEEMELWKNGSIACLNVRNPICHKILKRKKTLVGKSKETIEKAFGNPNISREVNGIGRYYYFVERGPQCTYLDRGGYDSLSVEVMFVFFNKNNKVFKAGGMKP